MPDPPETWVGLRVAVRPDGADAEIVTVPVNPLRAAIVIVEVPEDPALMFKLAGDALIVKSAVEGGGGVVGRVKFVVSGLPKPVT